MIRIPLRAALIALLLPFAGAAIAQTPPLPAATDGQGGGGMTLAQFEARQAERMMAADTDGDGRISLAEWTARANGRGGHGEGDHGGGSHDPAQLFARMDSNHDGFLDKTEIDAASAERFRRMDANGDGVISLDERMAMRGGMHRRGEHGGDESTTPPSTPQ